MTKNDDSENDTQNTNNDNDNVLSDHCISMRNAWSHCEILIENIIVLRKKYKNQNKDDTTRSTTTTATTTAFPQQPNCKINNDGFLSKNAQTAAQSIPQYQLQSLQQFYGQHLSSLRTEEEETKKKHHGTMDRVVPTDEDTAETHLEFRKKYLYGNIPCLIENLQTSKYFGHVTDLWTTAIASPLVCNSLDNADNNKNKNNDTTTNNTKTRIHDEWFLDHIGAETPVPIRCRPNFQVERNPHNNSQNATTTTTTTTLSLDEDGRAVECDTVERPLKEWIHLLRTSHEEPHDATTKDSQDTTKSMNSIQNMYLKDWHLQSSLLEQANNHNERNTPPIVEDQQQKDIDEGLRLQPPQQQQLPSLDYVDGHPIPLYTVPPQFQGDLLNGFLTKFTKGDYKFVYWGPPESRTDLHSDVLNSFSWSYNVIGEKEWTFYPPKPNTLSPSSQQHLDNSSTIGAAACIVITQLAGECMFVPSGWKHKVTNKCETLSINHNWITTANISRVWDCIEMELIAVDQELQAWSIDDDFHAKESMLRGCIGLDVTSFFFMCLAEYLRLLQIVLIQQTGSSASLDFDCYCDDNKGIDVPPTRTYWEDCFDMVRLRDILSVLLTEDNLERISLKKRLAAVLESEELAIRVLDSANPMLRMLNPSSSSL